MSLERDAMYALFEREPGDLTAYGAMADLLDADGWRVLAHAFRWMHHRGTYPHLRLHYAAGAVRGRKVSAAHRFAWYAESGVLKHVDGIWPKAPREAHALPRLILINDQTVFRTHQEAVMWLAERLAKLRLAYEAIPLKRAEL